MEAMIEYLFLITVIVQNITLLRTLRIGPFSAIDFVLTYWGAGQIEQRSRFWIVHFHKPWFNFFILLSIGEGLHQLFGLGTPFGQYITLVSEIFYYYISCFICIISYNIGLTQPCLNLFVR